VDISEAWKNPRLAGYYFGRNPANRFELTKGRDLIVDPAPASGPINFLVYPLLEMKRRDRQTGDHLHVPAHRSVNAHSVR